MGNKPVSVNIDYLSFRLTSVFNLPQLEAVCYQPVVDLETGEKVGILVAHDQLRAKTFKGGHTVISVYRGAEKSLYPVVKKENLPVTRLDICVDFEAATEKEAERLCDQWNDGLELFFSQKDYEVKIERYKNGGSAFNGNRGGVFFTRSGEKQLRVYVKKPMPEIGFHQYRVRSEWQLRGQTAKAVWAALPGPELPTGTELYEAWQALNYRFLDGDYFKTGATVENIAIEFPKKQKSDRGGLEHWLLGTVAKSIYNYWKDTGVNLSEDVTAAVTAMILAGGAQDGKSKNTPLEKAFIAMHLRQDQELLKLRDEAEATDNEALLGLFDEGDWGKILKFTLREKDEVSGNDEQE